MNISRESFNFPEENEPVTISISTKCPTKWLLIDRETGQIYAGNPGGYWDKLKPIERFDK